MRLPDFLNGDGKIELVSLCQHHLCASSLTEQRGHWREGPLAARESQTLGHSVLPDLETWRMPLMNSSKENLVCSVYVCMCRGVYTASPRGSLGAEISMVSYLSLGPPSQNKAMSHQLNMFTSIVKIFTSDKVKNRHLSWRANSFGGQDCGNWLHFRPTLIEFYFIKRFPYFN